MRVVTSACFSICYKCLADRNWTAMVTFDFDYNCSSSHLTQDLHCYKEVRCMSALRHTLLLLSFCDLQVVFTGSVKL